MSAHSFVALAAFIALGFFGFRIAQDTIRSQREAEEQTRCIAGVSYITDCSMFQTLAQCQRNALSLRLCAPVVKDKK